MKMPIKYLIGIDEAGRGPLAGPVAVGAVMVELKHCEKHLNGVDDSKKLTEVKREELYAKITELKKQGRLVTSVACVSHKIIDERGIVPAVNRAMRRCLNKINANPHQTLVLLDGSLCAPRKYIFQKTIIKGDSKVYPIAAASILAKVTRDRKMVRLAKIFPNYGFEIHKGYGTLRHRKQLITHGPCEIHRKSFIKNILRSVA